jgi:hypothetical protein
MGFAFIQLIHFMRQISNKRLLPMNINHNSQMVYTSNKKDSCPVDNFIKNLCGYLIYDTNKFYSNVIFKMNNKMTNNNKLNNRSMDFILFDGKLKNNQLDIK